jgi:predicted DCC family thiol-disulfide oxidoreductase YuxK
MTVVSKPALIIWHNSKCPVCEAGISRQRQRLRAAVAAGEIEFRDINLEPEALKAYGASVDDVRRRLHAVDRTGALLVGADVVVAVWRATPGEGWLATLFGAPVAIRLTRVVYDRFADVLWAWNKRVGRW